MTKRFLSLVALAAAMTLSDAAAAQSLDPAAAEATFDQGQAHFDKGEFKAAIPFFLESLRLDPAPGTLMSLAHSEEQVTLLADAWQHWREAIDRLAEDDPRKAFAKQRLAALEPRVPHLILTLAPTLPLGARVTRDGIEQGSASMGLPLPINPGEHLVILTVPGRAESRNTVQVAEGETKTLVVDLPLAPTVEPTPSPGLMAPPPEDTSFWEKHTASIITGGAAVVLAGVGGAFGVKTYAHYNDLATTCGKDGCTQEQRDSVHTDALLTNVFFGVAGAAAVASGAIFFFVEGTGDEPTVGVAPLPCGATVAIRY